MQNVTDDARLSQTLFCRYCGFENPQDYRFCQGCTRQKPVRFSAPPLVVKSPKRRLTYIILGLLLGMIGVHNLYAGRRGEGTVQLILFLMFFWTIIVPLGLIAWSFVEVCAVKTDGKGRLMS
jgi:TM2 domain-containing membrane protein YozV